MEQTVKGVNQSPEHLLCVQVTQSHHRSLKVKAERVEEKGMVILTGNKQKWLKAEAILLRQNKSTSDNLSTGEKRRNSTTRIHSAFLSGV